MGDLLFGPGLPYHPRAAAPQVTTDRPLPCPAGDPAQPCAAPRCENCLLRFRTHRSLFKHLHVCAEHAQSPAPPPPPALDKEPPAPERPPESDPALAPGLQFPLLEPFTTPAPAPTGPFLPYLNPAPFGLSPPRPRPFLAAAPGPPASSAAVWKKSQGECGGGTPEGWAGLPLTSDLDPPIYRRCRRQPAKTPGRLRYALRCVQVITGEGGGDFSPAGHRGYWEAAVPTPFPGGQKCHPRNTGFCL